MSDFFFASSAFDQASVTHQVDEALAGMDDGELFMEYLLSENLTFDDGVMRDASDHTMQGFGLRAILGEATAYAHSSGFTMEALKRASETVSAVKAGYRGEVNLSACPAPLTTTLYQPDNPLEGFTVAEKTELLKEVDAYVRKKDSRVKQVTASLAGQWQHVNILRPGGQLIEDIRPLVRMNISVVMEDNQRMERGSSGSGGRVTYSGFFDPKHWQHQADEAFRQAEVNLHSVSAPAGEMDVVLGPGWPGVLLHEAVGHGLEGDFNRKKTSTFSDRIGQRVAAKGVTVIDDGTMQDRRGSLNVDDEGTPTQKTVLIEDGILVNYMQDRLNARLMGMEPTGNGRRESYQHQIMPRMTNTYMLGGDTTQQELISRVKKGIYAPQFGGGQVDITSGKFVFSASEAYKIENGKITEPVKGATLIGNGPDVMQKITGIANDMELDPGIGTCGKDAQSVPVGVGQPSLLISGITVGGTEVN